MFSLNICGSNYLVALQCVSNHLDWNTFPRIPFPAHFLLGQATERSEWHIRRAEWGSSHHIHCHPFASSPHWHEAAGGLITDHHFLEMSAACLTPGPFQCVLFHDERPPLLQDSNIIQVRGNKRWCRSQVALLGSSFYCGFQSILALLTFHPSSLPASLFCGFKIQCQMERQQPDPTIA